MLELLANWFWLPRFHAGGSQSILWARNLVLKWWDACWPWAPKRLTSRVPCRLPCQILITTNCSSVVTVVITIKSQTFKSMAWCLNEVCSKCMWFIWIMAMGNLSCGRSWESLTTSPAESRRSTSGTLPSWSGEIWGRHGRPAPIRVPPFFMILWFGRNRKVWGNSWKFFQWSNPEWLSQKATAKSTESTVPVWFLQRTCEGHLRF